MSFLNSKSSLSVDITLTHRHFVTRNIGLDLVRASAIVLVVAAHLFWRCLSPVERTVLLWGGEAGVELFFSLSGFLIGGILINAVRTDFGPRAVGAFLFRRWMRTLPLYYMALWLHSWFFGVENVHAYLFLQSFFPGEPRAMVVSWSLVMEEYFYLFFPFAILMCASVIKPGVLSVIVISVGLIVICTVGRLLNVYGLQHVPAPVMHEHPFMRMDCAAYGVLAACLVSDNARTAQWMSASRCAWAFTFSVLIVVMWGILYTTLLHSPSSKLVIWGFPSWGPIYFAFQHSFLNMFFAVLIVSIFYMNIRMPYYLVFCVRNISCMSYSIYLFHTVIVEGANMYLPNEQSMTRFSLVIVVILAVAAISYYGIERPLLRLRDWLVPGRSTLARPGGHS